MVACTLTVIASTACSSITSGIQSELKAYFGLESESLLVLSTTLFLLGYVFGPLFWAPLSEQYGRRVIMWTADALLTAFVVASAVSQHSLPYWCLGFSLGRQGHAKLSL